MKKMMSAGLVIRDKRLLLVHNAKHGLRIEPPGGKVEPGEGVKGSVERELKEELGLEVRPFKLLGVYGTHSPEGEFEVHLYFCEIISGEPRVAEPEKVPGFGWYSYGEILEFRDKGVLVPNMVSALPDLKEFLL